MNSTKSLKSLFCRLLVVSIVVTKILSSAPIDSLAYYQSFYNKEVEKFTNLERQAEQLNSKIVNINAHVNTLSARENPNWNEKRKLSRLTAQKAELNNEMIRTFEKLASQKNTLGEVYHNYFEFLSDQINHTLAQYSRVTDSNQRQDLSRDLIKLVEQRSHLLATRRLFFDQNAPPVPDKENLIALVNEFDQNSALRNDVAKILEEKIQQIELLLSAAEAENQLRKRLNQLNLEMSALTGELYSDAMTGHIGDNDRGQTLGPTDGTWNDGTSNSKDASYENWANTANLPITSRPLTDVDYLPIFQTISTTNLSSYIFELDSLRRHYQKQLQEIKKK